MRAEQRLTLSYEGAAKTLQCYVEVSPERLLLVGTTALGQRVFSVTWDAEGRHVQGDTRATEQALRDLQLAAWPLTALQQAVAGTDWRIEEPRPGTRQVWRGKDAYAEIHYSGDSPWDGRSWLVNFDHRYSVDLDSKVVR